MKLNTKKILTELTRLDKNQSWLARQMGVSRSWINYIMTQSDRSFTFRTVDKIAKALNLDSKDLIK